MTTQVEGPHTNAVTTWPALGGLRTSPSDTSGTEGDFRRLPHIIQLKEEEQGVSYPDAAIRHSIPRNSLQKRPSHSVSSGHAGGAVVAISVDGLSCEGPTWSTRQGYSCMHWQLQPKYVFLAMSQFAT
eukprot:scaffold1531_cov296-Prasinococcus_capsulatus_cf.AAC.5